MFDQIIVQLLSGEINSVALLILFIIGILTKRFVPWWVHEEVVKKLEEYEEASPELIEEVRKLMDIMHDPRRVQQVDIQAPNAEEIHIESRKSVPVRRVRRSSGDRGRR